MARSNVERVDVGGEVTTHLSLGLAAPGGVLDDHGLTLLPSGRVLERIEQALARAVETATIERAGGRVEVELVARRVQWRWQLAHEADADQLTVFAPRREGVPPLPAPYLRGWGPRARALFLLDHDGALAARWAGGDLEARGLYRWGDRDLWDILDDALRARADVEWRDMVLVSPASGR